MATGKVAKADGLRVDHILARCWRAASASLELLGFALSSKLVKTVREFLVGLIVWKVELTLKLLVESPCGGSKSKGIEG